MKASLELEALNPILLTTEVERSGEGLWMDMRNIKVRSNVGECCDSVAVPVPLAYYGNS